MSNFIIVNNIPCPVHRAHLIEGSKENFAIDIVNNFDRETVRLWYPSKEYAQQVFDALVLPFRK